MSKVSNVNTMTSRLTEYNKFAETSLYPVIVAIFFASGFAALIYQIIWQRVLFTVFEINVEAATVVVTGFLVGLGFGSLLGGWLSRRSTIPLLALFGLIELVIGAFGSISLRVFELVGARTFDLPVAAATAVTLVLVIIPTLFMGATNSNAIFHSTVDERWAIRWTSLQHQHARIGSGLFHQCFWAYALFEHAKFHPGCGWH